MNDVNLPTYYIPFDHDAGVPTTPGVIWRRVPVSGIRPAIQWAIERSITAIALSPTGVAYYAVSGVPSTSDTTIFSTIPSSDRLQMIDLRALVTYTTRWVLSYTGGYLILIANDNGQQKEVPTYYVDVGASAPPGSSWVPVVTVNSEMACISACRNERLFFVAMQRQQSGSVECWCARQPDVSSLTRTRPSQPGQIEIFDLTILQAVYTFVVTRGGATIAKFSAVEMSNGYYSVKVELPGVSSSAPLKSSISASLPSGVQWRLMEDRTGVACVAHCALARFSYSAMRSRQGAPPDCFCADGQLTVANPLTDDEPGRYEIFQLPTIPDSTTYPTGHLTTEAIQLAPGLIRYVINGVAQPVWFLSPEAVSGAVRFASDSGGALSCITRCWHLEFGLAGTDGTTCVCLDPAGVQLSSTFRPENEDFAMVDIKKFLPAPSQSGGLEIKEPRIPVTNYVRLLINNVAAASWFVAGSDSPPGTWKILSGTMSATSCLSGCVQLSMPMMALQWRDGGFGCMCAAADVNTLIAALSQRYPTSGGSWQLLDISVAAAAAAAAAPLASMTVHDTHGQTVAVFSGQKLAAGYIQYSAQWPGTSSSSALQSAYASSLPSGYTWLPLQTATESQVQCVGTCFMMHFGAAAVKQDSCWCADVVGQQLAPSAAAPSQGGLYQLVVLPAYPAQQTSAAGSFQAMAIPMSSSVFRLIVNGAPLKPQFASSSSLSSADGITFQAETISSGEPDPTGCVLKCWSMHFPLVALVGKKCKCMESGAVSLQSGFIEGLQSVYDISPSFQKVASNAIMISRIPETNYVRFRIGDNVVPFAFVSASAVSAWKDLGTTSNAFDCIQNCLMDGHGLAAVIVSGSDRSTGCRCSTETGSISFSASTPYPDTAEPVQVFDLASVKVAITG